MTDYIVIKQATKGHLDSGLFNERFPLLTIIKNPQATTYDTKAHFVVRSYNPGFHGSIWVDAICLKELK